MLNNIFDTSNDSFQSCPSVSESSSSEVSFVSMPSLSETLDNNFSDVPKNLNLVHINAQSIPAHFSDMLASFNNKNIHAILVSESWLKPSLPSISYKLPGFNLIRNDRAGGGGGGVAIYLRSHFPYTVISTSHQPTPVNAGEHLFIEILLSHTKILLGVYYSNSSKNNFFASFEKILEALSPIYSHTIIMGDFNTCLIKRNRRSLLLENTVKSSNLNILPLSATHHFPNTTPSHLDLMIVSSLDHVAKHGQCPADEFSYHDLIFLSYKIRPPKCKPTVVLMRNFSGISQEAFIDDAKSIDWSPIFNVDSIDNQIDVFNSLISQLYDKHAPLRSVKIKHIPAPWLNDDLKELKHKKAAAKTKFKINSSDANKARYVKLRNRCNVACRDAQRRYIFSSVQNQDPAKVWRFLRSLGIGKSQHDSFPHNIDINSLNQHFSLSPSINRSDKDLTISSIVSNTTSSSYPPFVFSQFTVEDVKKSILSITSNATGTDGISRIMLFPILEYILPILCYILNFSISNSAFPSIWKEAQILPLPKKSNPKVISDFRPISILPFLSKVLERLVYNQLNNFLVDNHLLNPFQSGFRPGHSTVTTLVKVTDDIRFSMDNAKLTVLILLDFSNAFNSVDHDILVAILRSLNISQTVVDWFHSYLDGRRQRVRVENNFSSWCSTSAGVPQGGVLSPLLFAIFINSISNNLTSSYHLYADDFQLYHESPLDQLSNTIDIINDDLLRIHNWSQAHGLKLNPIKSQAIVVGSSRMICKIDWDMLPKIIINGVDVPFSDSVVNLGITVDQTLSWCPQLSATSRKLFASVSSLRRLQNLPIATKIALVNSLLHPILDYADACYPDLTEDQLNKLERLQNVCIRFIFGLRKYDHISEFRTKLKWLPIRRRRDAHNLYLLYNILFNPFSPRYLKERFEYLHASHDRTLRSKDNFQLGFPVHCTTFYNKSFTIKAIKLWNALPLKIKQSPSIHIFKKRVHSFYLSL